jgi:hypothetical protein
LPVRTHAHTSRSLLALPCFTLQFMGWAKLVCEKLDAKGHWSDYMDPCSGLAVRPAPPSLCAVPSRTEFNVLSCGGACGVLRCTAAHLAANPAIALTRTQVRTKECNSPYGEVEALPLVAVHQGARRRSVASYQGGGGRPRCPGPLIVMCSISAMKQFANRTPIGGTGRQKTTLERGTTPTISRQIHEHGDQLRHVSPSALRFLLARTPLSDGP